jgi:hypothetical protein
MAFFLVRARVYHFSPRSWWIRRKTGSGGDSQNRLRNQRCGGFVDAEAGLETGKEVAAEFADCGADAGAVDEAGDAGGLLPAGCMGLGADTPATLDPRPNFCKLSALSLPDGSRPLPD